MPLPLSDYFGEAVVTLGFELQNLFVVHTRVACLLNDNHPDNYLDLAVNQDMRVVKVAGIKSMRIPAGGTYVLKSLPPPELVVLPPTDN